MPGGPGCAPGSRTCRAIASSCSRKVLTRTSPARRGSLHFRQQHRHRREIEIAFQQGGAHAMPAIGMGQQRPHIVLHRCAVRIDLEVVGLVVMAGDVQAGDARRRHRIDEGARIVAVVDRVDVDVVDVEQQVAVGLGQHRVDEVDFAQRLVGRGVVADVLDRDAPPERILHLRDADGHVLDGFVGERQRQQVVEMAAGAAVAQVFAVEGDVVAIQELARLAHERHVQRVGPAQRQRQPVAIRVDDATTVSRVSRREGRRRRSSCPERTPENRRRPQAPRSTDPAGRDAGRGPHCALAMPQARAIRACRRTCPRRTCLRPSSCRRSWPSPSRRGGRPSRPG